MVQRSSFYLYHFGCSWCSIYYFYLDPQDLTCFPSKCQGVEVTLLQPGPHPTLWCFNDQCFYVFSVTRDDGVTEHRNMSG
jgi:hypothetical protein